MNKTMLATAFLAVSFFQQATAADVDVSVRIGQPGFYGRLDIGGYPPPQVIYLQPRVIVHEYDQSREPVYMRVPPGHAKNWRRYCRRYNACGEQVYFVQDSWYNHEYAPRYQEEHHDSRKEVGGKPDNRGNNRKGDRGNSRGHENH